MLLLHSSHQPSIKTPATRPPPEAPSPPYPLLMTSQYCKKIRKEKTKTRRLQVYRSRKSQKHYSIQTEPRFFFISESADVGNKRNYLSSAHVDIGIFNVFHYYCKNFSINFPFIITNKYKYARCIIYL